MYFRLINPDKINRNEKAGSKAKGSVAERMYNNGEISRDGRLTFDSVKKGTFVIIVFNRAKNMLLRARNVLSVFFIDLERR